MKPITLALALAACSGPTDDAIPFAPKIECGRVVISEPAPFATCALYLIPGDPDVAGWAPEGTCESHACYAAAPGERLSARVDVSEPGETRVVRIEDVECVRTCEALGF